MATPETAPPPDYPDGAGAAAAASPYVAGAVAPTAAAAAATAGIAGGAGLTAQGMIEALRRFSMLRFRSAESYVYEQVTKEYPTLRAQEVQALIDQERQFEDMFMQRMTERLSADLPKAFLISDPDLRMEALQGILAREQRFTLMREEAMLLRALGKAEALLLKGLSPQGAYWQLSPLVQEHTLDCLAMSEKFWPWAVLDRFQPPVHHGCQCRLLGLDEAVSAGLMAPDQIPDPADAETRAKKLLADAHDAMREVPEDDLRQWMQEAMERFAAREREPMVLTEERGHREIRRFAKGFVKGGQFMPERGSSPRVRALMKHLLNPESPARGRARGKHAWERIDGRQMRVPHDDMWERKIGGTSYVSPPGTTTVYAGGRPVADRPPMSPGSLSQQSGSELAEKIRDGIRKQGATDMARMVQARRSPINTGDPVSRLASLSDAGFRLEGSEPDGAGTRLDYRHANGATLRVTFTGAKVTGVSFNPAPQVRLPRQELGRPPQSWSEHTSDALAWADELGDRYDADIHLPEVRINRDMPDHAGQHQWSGEADIGIAAATDIENAAARRKEGKRLRPHELSGLWATYWTTAHEISHGVNGISPVLFSGEHANLEEALTEESAHVLAVERLTEQGQRDVLAWRQEHQDHPAVRGNYLAERAALGELLTMGGVTLSNDRRDAILTLKFSTPPEDRVAVLAGLIARANPETDFDAAYDLVSTYMNDRGANEGPALSFSSVSPGEAQVGPAYAQFRDGWMSSDGMTLHEPNGGMRRVEKLEVPPGISGLTDGTALVRYEPGQIATDGPQYEDGTMKSFRWLDSQDRGKLILRAYLGKGSPGDSLPEDPQDAEQRLAQMPNNGWEWVAGVPIKRRFDGSYGVGYDVDDARRLTGLRSPRDAAQLAMARAEGGPYAGVKRPVRASPGVAKALTNVIQGASPQALNAQQVADMVSLSTPEPNSTLYHRTSENGWVNGLLASGSATVNKGLGSTTDPQMGSGMFGPINLIIDVPPGTSTFKVEDHSAGFFASEKEHVLLDGTTLTVTSREGNDVHVRADTPSIGVKLSPGTEPTLADAMQWTDPETGVRFANPKPAFGGNGTVVDILDPDGNKIGFSGRGVQGDRLMLGETKIAPEWQRKGIGSRFLAHLEAQAPALGVKEIHANAESAAGAGYLKAAGYEGSPGAGSMVHMRKTLSANIVDVPAAQSPGVLKGAMDLFDKLMGASPGGNKPDDEDQIIKDAIAASQKSKPAYKPKPLPPDPLIGKPLGGTREVEDGPMQALMPDYNGTKLKLGKAAGGSNGARWAFDADEGRWLVKHYKGDQDRVATELLANAVYRHMGAKAATAGYIDYPSGVPDFTVIDDAKISEPDLPKTTKRISTGMVVLEDDGSVWTYEPRGHFGGYKNTFPKGGLERDLTAQQNAHKELWEETGLRAEPVAFLGDYEGDTSVSRFYLARRTGGEPIKSGKETKSVNLTSFDDAFDMLNRSRDKAILEDAEKMVIDGKVPPASGKAPVDVPEKTSIALTYPTLEGETRKFAPSEAVGRYYMTDALLANWDFIGMTQDNIMWGPDDEPFRVDQGGTFELRAQGSPKPFGPVPTEVWTMLSKGQGKRGVVVSEAQMRDQAQEIVDKLDDDSIDTMVSATPFKDEAMRERIRENLKARRDWMAGFVSGENDLPRPAEGNEVRELLSTPFSPYPEQSAAIEAFTHSFGRTVNAVLRDPKSTLSDATKTVRQTVEELDSVMRANKTDGDAYVWLAFGEGDLSGMVGKTFKERGFMAASIDADDVADAPNRVRALLPEGSLAFYTQGLDLDVPAEPELLVARGAMIKIERQVTNADGSVTTEATLKTSPSYKAPKPFKPNAPTGGSSGKVKVSKIGKVEPKQQGLFGGGPQIGGKKSS